MRQLQARTVSRVYAAVVHGAVAREGKVAAPIGRHPVSRTRMAVVARGKPAVTHYCVEARWAEVRRDLSLGGWIGPFGRDARI